MCMTVCTGVGAQLQELEWEGVGNAAHMCMIACTGVGAQLQELRAGGGNTAHVYGGMYRCGDTAARVGE